MTPDVLLSCLRTAGVVLTATGTDRLRVDAPQGALTPALREALFTHKAALLRMIRRFSRSARHTAAPQKQKKVWRRAPLWQVCADATRLPSGALDLDSADLLYAALALREGHTPDEASEMLRRCTPQASTRQDYCSDVVSRVSINPASYVTAELAARYATAHPFAWELGLYGKVSE